MKSLILVLTWAAVTLAAPQLFLVVPHQLAVAQHRSELSQESSIPVVVPIARSSQISDLLQHETHTSDSVNENVAHPPSAGTEEAQPQISDETVLKMSSQSSDVKQATNPVDKLVQEIVIINSHANKNDVKPDETSNILKTDVEKEAIPQTKETAAEETIEVVVPEVEAATQNEEKSVLEEISEADFVPQEEQGVTDASIVEVAPVEQENVLLTADKGVSTDATLLEKSDFGTVPEESLTPAEKSATTEDLTDESLIEQTTNSEIMEIPDAIVETISIDNPVEEGTISETPVQETVVDVLDAVEIPSEDSQQLATENPSTDIPISEDTHLSDISPLHLHEPSPAEELNKAIAIGSELVKVSEPAQENLIRGSGKSLTSNSINQNQINSNSVAQHFGFSDPSHVVLTKTSLLMHQGTLVDPRTLVDPPYRGFFYANDSPDVTAAKVAFFRLQAAIAGPRNRKSI